MTDQAIHLNGSQKSHELGSNPCCSKCIGNGKGVQEGLFQTFRKIEHVALPFIYRQPYALSVAYDIQRLASAIPFPKLSNLQSPSPPRVASGTEGPRWELPAMRTPQRGRIVLYIYIYMYIYVYTSQLRACENIVRAWKYCVLIVIEDNELS